MGREDYARLANSPFRLNSRTLMIPAFMPRTLAIQPFLHSFMHSFMSSDGNLVNTIAVHDEVLLKEKSKSNSVSGGS